MRGKRASFSLILGAAAALFVVVAEASRSDGGFEVAGHVGRPLERPLAGGAFVLSGEVVTSLEASGVRLDDEPTRLLSHGGEQVPMGTPCFCAAAIFGDGFESGGTAAWSETLP